MTDDSTDASSGDDTDTQPDGGVTGSAPPARRVSSGDAEVGVASETHTPSGTVNPDQIAGLARREYRVLARARWHFGLALLFGVFSVAVVGLTGSAAGPTGAGAVLLTLAELSVYLVPLAALALGYGTVVGASERGTLELLLSLPMRRHDVLVGKFLGRAVTFATGTTLGLGAGAVVVAVRYGFAVVPAYLHYLLTAVSVGVAFLAVGVGVSAATDEKAHALGAALLAWVWFVLVYDLVAIGAVVALDPPAWALPVVVLGNPADALRLVVLSLVPRSGGGVASSLVTTALPAWALVGGLVAWTVVPLLVGGRLLDARA